MGICVNDVMQSFGQSAVYCHNILPREMSVNI